jgi:hypothetical protein
MPIERWFLFGTNVFAAVACLAFLITYQTRAAGFRDPIGRTLIAIKFGIFGVAALIGTNMLININVATVRIVFALLMIQIGAAVLWQTITIFRVNREAGRVHTFDRKRP